MRRLLIGLAVALIATAGLAGPASAARNDVNRLTSSGTSAFLRWEVGSPTGFTNTVMTVSTRTGEEPKLSVEQTVATVDQDGNVAGGTQTTVEVTSGFTFSIDEVRLDSASVSALAVPATTCVLDPNGEPTDCAATTIDVFLNWTGQGAITRSVSNSHVKGAGPNMNQHSSSTERAALAAGAVGDLTLTTSDDQSANLQTFTYNQIKR